MGFWDVIGLIFAGLVIGALARLFLPGRQRIGMLATVGVGILGTLGGYGIAAAIGVKETAGVDWIRWIISIAIAAGLVSLVTAFMGRGSGSTRV
ncbi:GlsB/YeaQ/YmgE family stress response membrane protein [Yinghuangia sp. ASG 101]|uniref:GlsB/YeaQ/YmgE family stress response membrane protein n=1 Tax=Yinghuangia sp. ASG 101 TaxID=2896848 RepID=UPI001E5D8D86|nr:GlsB/YeaQ/YmgE family stress response membrane protein [Yinghuangia sp. ASG 101]UGQ14844.1 GlsB/YeaQ/YmgE family stress response membrane protein [Yinghuangia sp. ASG 101]